MGIVDEQSLHGLTDEDGVGAIFRGVLGSIFTEIDSRLTPQGLTHAQGVPLFHMADGGCATAGELARALQSDAGAMSRTLDRLEAKGLLARVRSSDDRRIVNLKISDAGREMAALVPPVLAEVLNLHLAGFTWTEWRQLLGLLKRMRTNGDALDVEPLPAQRPRQP
jgi:DNA-binding MarR family transcriptional regulator